MSRHSFSSHNVETSSRPGMLTLAVYRKVSLSLSLSLSFSLSVSVFVPSNVSSTMSEKLCPSFSIKKTGTDTGHRKTGPKTLSSVGDQDQAFLAKGEYSFLRDTELSKR